MPNAVAVLYIDNLLHRQVGGVGALENAVEVPRRQTVQFGKINPIANQSA